MALLFTLTRKEKHLERVFSKCNAANDLRQQEFHAAATIQWWFRTLIHSKHVKTLHSCAVIIQKKYRAYVTRKSYRKLVQLVMLKIVRTYHDMMATRIQALWRAFITRKVKADYYRRQEYLNALVLKNKFVESRLHEIEEINRFRQEVEIMEKEKAEMIYNYRKTHYLLSTKSIRGIYNSQHKPCPEKECALLACSPLSSNERTKQETDKTKSCLKQIKVDADEQIIKTKFLPPVRVTKIQGPFRKPREVQRIRYKEQSSSSSDYQSVNVAQKLQRQNEWSKQIIDEDFLRWTKPPSQHNKSLNISLPYIRPDYGTKFFREERVNSGINCKPFQNVVSPIPYFDQVEKN